MTHSRRRLALALITVAAMLATVPAAPASASFETQIRLTAEPDTHLGGRVATDGATLVTTATIDGSPGFGAVHVFVRDGATWRHQDRLTPDDATAWQAFGSAVAVDGELVVVGASFDSEAAREGGAAYVFTRSGDSWTQLAKLTAESDAVDTELFGSAVAISGNMILVGAPHETGFRIWGSVYVFQRFGNDWIRHSRFFGTVGDDHFGQSLDVDGNTLVVGAPWEFSSGEMAGAAYVHTWNGAAWARQARLVSPDGAEDDRMGGSVALDGDTAVVGAVFHDVAHSNEGAAYVFTRSDASWSFQQKLTAPISSTGDRFGSVALAGDLALIGASFAGDAGRHSGMAYLFNRSDGVWLFDRKLVPADHGRHDRYGSDVDLIDGTAVAGAHGAEPFGAVYVHHTTIGLRCNRLPATIVGTEGDDVIIGTSGADVIHGLGGNDVLSGLRGDDVICGGSGNDTIRGGAGADTLLGGAGRDNLSGGPGSDSVRGQDGADTLRGGDQADLLAGGLDDDRMFGGGGADVLKGGSGTDLANGGPAADTCTSAETVISC